MYAESRSRVGHHVLYAALMHGDDVGLAFYHEHAVFLCNGLLGLIDAVELMVFLVNVGLWRVYILLCHALGARVEHASREPNHLTADRKSTRLNSSHANISYAVFCLKKKKNTHKQRGVRGTRRGRSEAKH